MSLQRIVVETISNNLSDFCMSIIKLSAVSNFTQAR